MKAATRSADVRPRMPRLRARGSISSPPARGGRRQIIPAQARTRRPTQVARHRQKAAFRRVIAQGFRPDRAAGQDLAAGRIEQGGAGTGRIGQGQAPALDEGDMLDEIDQGRRIGLGREADRPAGQAAGEVDHRHFAGAGADQGTLTVGG